MQTLIFLTDIVEKLILLLLLGLSIWSIAIMIDRRRAFKDQTQKDFKSLQGALEKNDMSQAKKWCEQNPGVVAESLLAAINAEKNTEKIDRSVASLWKRKKQELEKGFAVLGTLGANAPFIGLFGTVLGIIRAFAYLGSQSGSASVMSGVSQALYATAAGLFVAIPAVIAFNFFSKCLRDLQSQVEALRDLYVSISISGKD